MPTVQVNGIDLFYQDDSYADPWQPHETIFVQHGFSRNGNFFRAWVPWLAREYRVIRMDLRGCGQSGDPGPDYQYSLDGFLADFFGFLDALGIDRVHYVAESLGGIIGAAAAARHPERFRSLTLISTPVRVNENSRGIFAVGYPTWQDALRELGMKGWWMKAREVTGELTGNPAADDYFATEFARTPVHVAIAISQAVPGVNIAEFLPQIQVPTLMLTPGDSPHTSAEEQAEISRLIPGAQQRIYPGATHSMYHLIPDQLAADTLGFIKSVGAGGPPQTANVEGSVAD